jgi:prepilin-type N-terminal cleavage/methylation domain-containing protein
VIIHRTGLEKPTLPGGGWRVDSAFSLLEVIFAVAIVGVLVITLYGALAGSVTLVKSCQENERATQILSEKMDTIRLYNWTQMTNGFVPTNFVAGIDPLAAGSPAYYTGRIVIAHAPLTESYRSNILQVTVSVNWVSDSRPQSRSMSTFVAKYGLQSYIMR